QPGFGDPRIVLERNVYNEEECRFGGCCSFFFPPPSFGPRRGSCRCGRSAPASMALAKPFFPAIGSRSFRSRFSACSKIWGQSNLLFLRDYPAALSIRLG